MSVRLRSISKAAADRPRRGRRSGIVLGLSAVLISSSTISTSPVQAVSLPSAAKPSTTTAESAVAAAASTGEVSGNFQPADPRASFLPTMSQSAYATEKAAAASAARSPKPEPTSAVASPSVAGPSLAAPTVIGQNFRGIDQPKACACGPSDTHGVVGPSHYVQIVNSRIVMYNKSTKKIVKSASLNSFFNYTGAESKMVFDPRAAYDAVAQRYIFTGAAFVESNNEQYFFIAVSKTSSPTGEFWVYKLLVNGGDPKVFFDYPQLGMDRDAILVTANVFGTDGYPGTPYFFKKSALYTGIGFAYSSFPKLTPWTLASTRVLDDNATTFMVSARGSGVSITKLGFMDTGSDTPKLTERAEIPVASFTMAPDARQPGTNATLDTLESRFVDSSTQFGNRLFNAHTVAHSGHPTPMFYEFDTIKNNVTQSGFFGASTTSDDWNASLAANTSGEVFVTYSSTDTVVKPQVRVSGKQSTDAYIPAGVALTTSSTVFTTPSPARWGDYSSTTLDPSAVSGCAANRRAWGTNQIVVGGPTWGSQIGRFGFC